MNKKIRISLLACMLIGTVGLLAQVTRTNNSTRLSKKGDKIMLDSITYANWDALNNKFFKSNSTEKFYYDTNGNNTIRILASFYENLNSYIDHAKYIYTFNSDNKKKLLQSFVNYDGVNWVKSGKTEYFYDSIGNQISLKQYNFNSKTNQFDMTELYYYKYNNSNKVITIIDSSSNSFATKIVNIYDSSGSRITNTEYLVKGVRIDYFYDSSNKLSHSINNGFYDSLTESIKNKGMVKYIYDLNGNIQSNESYGWNNTLNKWEEDFSKHIYSVNNSIFNSDLVWDFTKDQNDLNDRNDFYDYNGYNNFNSSTLIHLITSVTTQYTNNKQTINVSINKYHYSPFKASSSTNELKEKSNINIYPNPTNGMININTNKTIENINITDVNGKLVHHQINNSPIDLSQHAKGIYFVNITSEKGVINKKIVLN